MKVLPTDSRFLELTKSPELTAFTYYWLQKSEDDFFDRISKLLGTNWTHEELLSFKESKKNSNKSTSSCNNSGGSDIFVPLLLGINPNFLDGYLEKMGGSSQMVGGYEPEKGEDVVSLGNMSKDKFMSMYNINPKNK